ncbi:ABC transporter C family member 13 isoform X5 [Elaeis guineensis]|uniref:ABC transporter C family member 13 isoform X5 n=1 Tax=Elaeis guineensis var. tenera TaxID=51953 RepID=UPI003C6D4517
MDVICPKTPIVWDGKSFTRCFENMVLGFGANMITVAAVLVLGVHQRNARTTRNIGIGLLEKVFLYILPAFGSCLSFYEMFLLMKSSLEGHNIEYHDWLFRCSQFVSWMAILLVSQFRYWFHVFCNPILCCWWILKPVLEIPLLLTKFSSLEVMTCLKESSSIFAEFMFGLFVIVVKAMHASKEEREFDSIEDPLLSHGSAERKDHIIDADWKFSSCFDLVTFKFVNMMMDLGVTRQLDFKDLVELPCDLMPSSCHCTLLRCWVAEQNKHSSNPSLFRAMCYAYGWPYLRLGLLKAINDSVGLIVPLLLNRLIQFLQQGSGDVDGYILALSLGFTSILKSFLDTQYTFRLMKLKLMLRSSIMIIVYRKCLFINLAERSNFSDGEIQTFMSIDADRTANLCNSLHDVWSLPLQIGVALYLLYTQVSFAFVSGVAITILLIPVNKWISTMIISATEKMMKQKDERIRGAGELLTYIRTLKMYSWEHLFTERLMERRAMEVQHLSTKKYLDAWCVFFWATTPTLFSLSTFGIFALMGHSLSAATVFTCVALFNTLISPLNSFPWVINGLIEAIVSSRRLSKYLSCPEHNSEWEQSSGGRLNTYGPSPCLFESEVDASANPRAIVFQNASCVWSSSYEVGHNVILDSISLDFPKGIFVAIIGEVGSGKSSLLNSILGEMHLIHGVIQSRGSLAYVPQVPWIQSGSVRDNILFGKEYDARRYREVLQACALDIDISLMIGGDLAYIGEKGVNLSGGQRARLALARAVYCDSDIYLLDDVLSAVDSQVACWILQRTILGPLVNKKTRVLCTHNVQAISSADMIVIMDRGHVKWAGMSASFFVSPYLATYVPNNSKFLLKESIICASDELRSNLLLESDFSMTSEEAQETAETEFRKEGRVELSVYKCYATFASWPVVFVICVSAFLMQASRNGNDLWLSYWVDTTTGTENTRFYLVILSIFGLANSIFTLARAFSFAYGGLRAAVQVHNKLLNKLVNAPVHFFDQNPSGRILNRLSSDLYTLDDSLPFILNILLANFYSLLGIVVVLSYVQIIFLLLLFPLWYVYSKLQFYYRSTSRELRRLDSVSRSPIYSCFTETLDGSSTIRALKKEEFFMGRFMEHVTLYQQTSYSELTASLWLSLRLQVGIVGRTGAGKSSVLNALFRLTPVCNGRILVDGIDVADIAIRNLRGHFAVVPQSPFLFEGSLRENLDPSGMTTDEKIWEALQKCHIKAEIESAGGLDLHVKESGTSFSVGQRQLICLARAIIKSSKILCLDECTANVDTQTALILQNTISNECKGMTILTIAHRISTVLSMDKILILDHGNLGTLNAKGFITMPRDCCIKLPPERLQKM